MRLFIALLVVVYLVGVGVVLAPTISIKWSTAAASDLVASVWLALPHALAWPVTEYHQMMGEPEGLKTNAG